MLRRKISLFEKILSFVGILLGGLGFYLIDTIYKNSGKLISYEMLIAVFLWIILLFLVIITATAENQREESIIIDRELHEETKLMREMIRDQVIEIRLLREELSKLGKIDKDIRKK